MIDYKEYQPSQQFTSFIECYWTLNSHCNDFSEKELIAPGGRAELLFNFGDPLHWHDPENIKDTQIFTGALLLGPRDRFYFLTFTGNINVFGVRFKAGGLAPFIKIPVHEVRNIFTVQQYIIGREYDNWLSQMQSKLSADAKISFIENILFQQFCNPDISFKHTLQLISFIKSEQPESISKICDVSGMYYKKLERNFLQYSGYSPKTFSSVNRFYKSLQMAQKNMPSLTHVGIECGYYDQAHFIREFKKFSGITPSNLEANPTRFLKLLAQSATV